ncbi:MAG: DUF2254 domain-containing protein [Phycisphaerae bacterium]
MPVWILKYWERLRSSFWFLPALMALASIALALGMLWIDGNISQHHVKNFILVYSGGPAGASAVMTTIVSSMMTITGVVFSMTLVTLSLASQQFGPRLLRNFMRDTANQVVLGTFIATFLYCLLVLRTIRRPDENAYVPHLSVTLGVLLALASLGVLIYFIHHVAVSIQADEILARVSGELLHGIDRLFPQQIGRGNPEQPSGLPATFETDAATLCADCDGYLQFIDPDGLMSLAAGGDLLLRIERRPGDFVIAGQPLARLWPPGKLDEPTRNRLRALFTLGHQRTPAQDVSFSILQLVEVAIRALSPGINDPFTAATSVDHLAAALCRLATRKMPSGFRHDAEGHLRIVAPRDHFADFLDEAFTPIRQAARGNHTVTLRLLHGLASIAERAAREEDRAALRRQGELVARSAREAIPDEHDRQLAESHWARLQLALDRPAR